MWTIVSVILSILLIVTSIYAIWMTRLVLMFSKEQEEAIKRLIMLSRINGATNDGQREI